MPTLAPARPACSRQLIVATALARLTESEATAVLPFSTGVIGELLPAEQISAALPAALDDLCDTGWERAAGAILTTDTRAKLRSTEVELDGQHCTITGIAKGAGMICPNMATMLSFVATDAAIEAPLLNELLSKLYRRASIASRSMAIPRPTTPSRSLPRGRVASRLQQAPNTPSASRRR